MTDTNGTPEVPVDAAALAGMVASATDEQLAEGMASENRALVLSEIFKRMADHANPEKLGGIDAVVHFKILDHPQGGYDHWEVVIANGAVEVTDEPSRDPRLTLKIKPVDFLRLVTGGADGPLLFMRGRLKLDGDIIFAARLTSLFTIPKAAA